MNIELYTRNECHSCVQTKRTLNEQGLTFTEHCIGTDITRDEVIAKFPGVHMLPVVVVDGIMIGTREDLLTLINNVGDLPRAGTSSPE